MFFTGMVTTVFALILETIISILNSSEINTTLSTSIYSSIAMVAFIEEFLLGTVIWKTSQKLTQHKEILIGSIFIGLGFSFFEIFLNTLSQPEFHISLIFSYLGLLLIHATTSSIFGFYFSSRGKWDLSTIVLIFLLNSIIHFIFNFAILNNFNQLLVYTALAISLSFLYLQAFRSQEKYSLPTRKN